MQHGMAGMVWCGMLKYAQSDQTVLGERRRQAEMEMRVGVASPRRWKEIAGLYLCPCTCVRSCQGH